MGMAGNNFVVLSARGACDLKDSWPTGRGIDDAALGGIVLDPLDGPLGGGAVGERPRGGHDLFHVGNQDPDERGTAVVADPVESEVARYVSHVSHTPW